MKKKHLALLSIAALIVALVAIGTTFARGSGKSENNKETISEYALSVAACPDTRTVDVEGFTPGGSLNTVCSVRNDQTGNAYSVYVKTVIYHSFDCDTSELDADMVTLIVKQNGEEVTIPRGIDYKNQDSDTLTDWIIAYSDEEEVVLYYKHPLKQGEESSPFLDSISFSSEMSNEYTDSSYNLEMEISAVQVNAGQDAMAAEFGVFPSFDEEGNIVSVSEEKMEETEEE